jgi:integrase
MSIYKRGETWWIRIHHGGKEIRRTTGTENKKQAQQFHDNLKTNLWKQEKLGDKPAYLWEEAVVRWFSERKDWSSAGNWKYQLQWLHPHLCGVALESIDQRMIAFLRAKKEKEGVKNGTVNSLMSVVRSVLRSAVQWEWLDKAPIMKNAPEPSRRVRYLSDDEEMALLNELPLHIKQIARFALCTGLRMNNILALQWEQVDILRKVAWIHPDQAKAGKAISIPLNNDACLILREQMGQHLTHIFSYNGLPLLKANGNTWRDAVKRSGVKNFTFHGLRHTWASRLIQAGTPVHALMEMGGWSDVSMVRKYAHFGSEHLLDFANKINKPAQKPAHPVNLELKKSG